MSARPVQLFARLAPRPLRSTNAYNALITFIDQIALSAVSMTAGAAFIRAGAPAEYGLFTAYLSIFYLVASAQNALINTPLIVLPRFLEAEARKVFHRGMFGLGVFGSLIAAVAIAFVTSIRSALSGGAITLGVVASLSFGPLLVREFLRAREFAAMNPRGALRRDGAYAVLAIGGIGYLALRGDVAAIGMFVAFGVPAIVICLPSVLRDLSADLINRDAPRAIRMSWSLSSWSFLSAMASWVQGNVYIYIPLWIIGAQSVGFLAAARLTMMPISLFVQSWPNFLRPVASERLAHRPDSQSMRRMLLRSSIGIVAMVSVYSVLVVWAVSAMPAGWIPANYRKAVGQVVLWGIVLGVQGLRTNASSFLQSALAFRMLAADGVVAAGLTVVAAAAAVVRWGAVGSLYGLIVGELLLLVLMLLQFRGTVSAASRAQVFAAPSDRASCSASIAAPTGSESAADLTRFDAD